jgi:hypothetical protein
MLITNRLLRTIKHKVVNKLAKAMDYCLSNEISGSLLLNPKNIAPLKRTALAGDSSYEFVIVLQGPVADQDSMIYLQRTLNIYRAIFPNVKIVLSSYLVNQEFLRRLESDGYDQLLLINDEDLKSNFERQVKSTSEGILAAAIYNRKYIIKSRVDQRFTEPTSLLYFKFLLETFPPNNANSEARILGSSFNSWLYRPLGISDMLIVGSYSDMVKYWIFDDAIANYSLRNNISEYDQTWFPNISLHFESFLAARFLASYGFNFTFDPIKDTNEMWRDFMVVVDANTIGHEWKKRNNFFVGNTLTKYGSNLSPNSLKEISFLDWLAFQSGEFVLNEIDDFLNF